MLLIEVVFLSLVFSCFVAAIVWSMTKKWAVALSAFAIPVVTVAVYQAMQPQAMQPDPAEQVVQPKHPTSEKEIDVAPVARTLADFDPYRPAETSNQGYVASDACVDCHKDQHQSWHASYHRSMTQTATPDAVLGNFDGVEVHARGRRYKLEREGEVCWVTMNDPDLAVSVDSEIDVPIVMTTGSHHMQVCWYPTGIGRTLGQLPIVYLKETAQWVPRTAAFLRPNDTSMSSETGRWNTTCSKCHTTHSRSRPRADGVWDTLVSEFGISCESCHGPAERHIAFHRSNGVAVEDDPIVNPKNLSHRASSQVCGQCHSVIDGTEDRRLVNERGHGFRPGMNLDATHEIWQRDSESVRQFLDKQQFPGGHEQALRSVFWDDGMIRIAGREYNGMLDSSCFINGEMSCLSCHSMHQDDADQRDLKGWANDQLAVDALSDAACTNCHSADAYGSSHTHHTVESSGSRCYNCHMPHTTYGLLKAIRSHTIVSPHIGRDKAARRPNACNLCHLDKTLAWSASAMNEWYDTPIPELSDEEKSIAASILWLLKGDAGLRALAAWHMGWDQAQMVSGRDWIAPLIARTLDDPYSAVRFIARRSLLSLPNFSDFEFNAIADKPQRDRAIASAIKIWSSHYQQTEERPEILVDQQGSQVQRIIDLMKQRDNTKVNLVE